VKNKFDKDKIGSHLHVYLSSVTNTSFFIVCKTFSTLKAPQYELCDQWSTNDVDFAIAIVDFAFQVFLRSKIGLDAKVGINGLHTHRRRTQQTSLLLLYKSAICRIPVAVPYMAGVPLCGGANDIVN
jgi:hypothetical protein